MKFLAKWKVRKPASDDQTPYISERFGVRTLHIGSDTVQSAMRLAKPNDLELSYTRSMMAFLLFMPPPRDVLMIGLGGGSLAKFIYHHVPQARIRAVEVSPEVVAIARHYFHVPADDPRFQVVIADGSEYVLREDVAADVVIVDGYDADAHAEELASRDFYAACRDRLRDRGMLVVNLWGGDKLFETLVQRIESAFPGGSLCLPAERPGNVIVFGFRMSPAPLEWTALQGRAQSLEKAFGGLEFPRFVDGLRTMNRSDQQFLYAARVRAKQAGTGFP
jgi:spermidine synthase